MRLRLVKRVILCASEMCVNNSIVAVLVLLVSTLLTSSIAQSAEVEFSIRDASTMNFVPCRIHLLDTDRKPIKPIGISLPYWKDHFVCNGHAKINVPASAYECEIVRGPEYSVVRKSLVATDGRVTSVEATLQRLTHLSQEGWWSGETHIHRPLSEIPLLMQAEDLHIGVVMTWWNDKTEWKERSLPDDPITVFDTDRIYDVLGGEDERGGGALLFSGLKTPLSIVGSKRESPPSVKWLNLAKQQGAWVDAEKPFWWDFPVWLSTGKLDSIGIANNHMNRGGMYAKGEAWGRARDLERFPDPLGNGLWSQAIYYHALNAGFRVPPSAGSASGVLPNPVGYNRMYVHVDHEFNWNNWWSSAQAGKVFVTNGPLIRIKANQHYSGHLFQADGPIDITIEGQIDSRDTISAIQLVHNGRVESIAKLPATVRLAEPGWFLVRVMTDVSNTFRFASTGPWYLEIGRKSARIDRSSCEFFREWTDQRIDALRQTLTTEEERREVLPIFEATSKFWSDREAEAAKD